MIFDFHKKKTPLARLEIKNESIDIVNSFKFLGTTTTNDLKWHVNITLIVKKAHQRLYFLRQLKKFNMKKEMKCLV